MAQETAQLAEYAAGLRYGDIPAGVVERAKDTIADTIAAIAFGAHLPWSRMILGYAQKRGAGGKSRVFAPGGARLQAPSAAFANGALAHAFEMDNLTWPNTGVHPGATMAMPALAVAQERGIGGRALIEAVVAGSELMIRVGRATKHNNEGRGFHAPGTTGPFGSAAAVGRLLKFDKATMSNALGIAGSTSAGLLEFAKSGTGAMVKRLHLGRAAEAGIMAAQLAEQGFTGPGSVLEGPFGFLNVYCGEHDAPALTRGLGSEWASLRIMLKRFPVHITSHTSVQAIEDLQREHGYAGDDVASIHVAGNQKMATVNNIPSPSDLMMAQYSLPFCVALAHHHDARDPASFNLRTFNDRAIRDLASRVTITVSEEAKHGHTIASTVSVTLKGGRVLTKRVDSFKGTPQQPLNRAEMREKFLLLTRHCDGKAMARLFERLQGIEDEKSLDWVKVDAAKKKTAKPVKRAAAALALASPASGQREQSLKVAAPAQSARSRASSTRYGGASHRSAARRRKPLKRGRAK